MTVNHPSKDIEGSNPSTGANTKTIGDISEAVIIAELIKLGERVLIPFGDNSRYDIAVDKNGTLVRIQVKSGRYINGCVEFQTASTYAHRGGKRKGYVGQIDYFGIYCHELDKIYFVPIEEAPATTMRIRVDSPKKRNSKIREATNFGEWPNGKAPRFGRGD